MVNIPSSPAMDGQEVKQDLRMIISKRYTNKPGIPQAAVEPVITKKNRGLPLKSISVIGLVVHCPEIMPSLCRKDVLKKGTHTPWDVDLTAVAVRGLVAGLTPVRCPGSRLPE